MLEEKLLECIICSGNAFEDIEELKDPRSDHTNNDMTDSFNRHAKSKESIYIEKIDSYFFNITNCDRSKS